ncbi:hypothetical protein Taro_035322 [Colocasia esculenta]|uniref:Uncharacterized protein n=1 Tax=Colocasia esculenta TaxID=4460 RepID=A0A843WEJ7_COLES|nr:hypothetical protein [Colocasia esculenta]
MQGHFVDVISWIAMLKKPLLWDKIHFQTSPMLKMKLHPYMIIFGLVMFFIVYHITSFQYQQTQVEKRLYPFDSATDPDLPSIKLDYLPRGIVQASSDMEMKPLWSTRSSSVKDDADSNRNLLAIPAGIKQRRSVDAIVRKFLSENFTVILFHYDGNVNGWQDLQWCNKAIHVAAQNQTKWWFAKRFLHPDVVSIYDYIFLWDEDLGLENFHPGRYLSIVKAEGLEISQPALDPKQSEVHHKITIRKKRYMVHRWVEGMAPVFSRSAWCCTWHLIQNDLIHGWGMDMKLGYCAQGDRRKKVGVVDSEFIVHRGVQTLGGSSTPTPHKGGPLPTESIDQTASLGHDMSLVFSGLAGTERFGV